MTTDEQDATSGKLTHCPICGSRTTGQCISCLSAQSKCVICFGKFEKGDDVTRCLECNHVAHTEHMAIWLQKHEYCPVCKEELRKGLFEELTLRADSIPHFLEIRTAAYVKREETFNEFSFRLPFYEFQSAVLFQIVNALEKDPSVLLISPPGSGKTIIALALARELATHTLVLTPNLAVLGSWIDRAEMFFDPQDASLKAHDVIGRHTGDLRPITVITYQRLNTELRAEKKRSKAAAEGKKTEGYPRVSLIERLQKHQIGLVVLDEAHRLTKNWGRNVSQLLGRLPEARVIGLTATPPARKFHWFDSIFAHSKVFIPRPPLVRDRVLAPYRDASILIPECSKDDFHHLHLLTSTRKEFGDEIRGTPLLTLQPDATNKKDGHEDSDEITSVVKKLFNKGVQEHQFIQTEVTAETILYEPELTRQYQWLYRNSSLKLAFAFHALRQEMELQGDKIRALIVFDFETPPRGYTLKHKGTGGAIGAFQMLVRDKVLDLLDPIFVTGKSLLVDDDFTSRFLELGKAWAKQHALDIRFAAKPGRGGKYHTIRGRGRDWNTETYTRYVTHLFDQGICKCLVGTRFLLGEGWDSLTLNTVIDLTCVTTYTSVNQIKGRALRKDPQDPQKVSNLWEFVNRRRNRAIFAFEEFQNFVARHKAYWGLDTHGNIRSGANRLFSRSISLPSRPKHKFDADIREAARGAFQRKQTYKLWKVGVKIGNLCYAVNIPAQMQALPNKRQDEVTRGVIVALSDIFLRNGIVAPHFGRSLIDNYERNGITAAWFGKLRRENDETIITAYTPVSVDQESIDSIIETMNDPEWKYGYLVVTDRHGSWINRMLRHIGLGKPEELVAFAIPSPWPSIDMDVSTDATFEPDNEMQYLNDLLVSRISGATKVYRAFKKAEFVIPEFTQIRTSHIGETWLESEFVE